MRELSSQCERVVEFGMRHRVSTVALLAGQPRHLLTIATRNDPAFTALHKFAGNTKFEYRFGTSLDTDVPECDLLFLDTRHTADHLSQELLKHASQVRRWLVFHDTEVYGETGEDGGPGLIPALRDFLQREPQWHVVSHTAVNHGLTVISRDPQDDALEPCPISSPKELRRATR